MSQHTKQRRESPHSTSGLHNRAIQYKRAVYTIDTSISAHAHIAHSKLPFILPMIVILTLVDNEAQMLECMEDCSCIVLKLQAV